MWHLNMVIAILIACAGQDIEAELKEVSKLERAANKTDVFANQTKDLAPNPLQVRSQKKSTDPIESAESSGRFEDATQDVANHIGILREIKPYANNPSKTLEKSLNHFEVLGNLSQGVKKHLTVLNEIKAYVKAPTNASASNYSETLGMLSKSLVNNLEALSEIDDHVTKLSKLPTSKQSVDIENISKDVMNHLNALKDIETYVIKVSKEPALDHQEILGNFSYGMITNHLDIVNKIKANVNMLSKTVALYHSEGKTQNSSSLSEREQINIRTPSGMNIFPKIVGGNKTDIRTYPYIVQIYMNRAFHCGGSILTTQHILTAAHCVKAPSGRFINPKRFLIRAGTTFLFKGGSQHRVAAYVVHPKHNEPVAHDNDIAIAAIDNHFVYTDDVQKASLPPQNYSLPVNATVIAIGWGVTNVSHNNSKSSECLNHVTIRHIDQSACEVAYTLYAALTLSSNLITTNMMCAGDFGVGGKDACQGDSGGPLVNDHVVVGLGSWGYACGNPYLPEVYTRVSSYTDWIHNVIDTDDPEHSQMISENSTIVFSNIRKYSNAAPVGIFNTNILITLSLMLMYCT